jgi:hypothetical protein
MNPELEDMHMENERILRYFVTRMFLVSVHIVCFNFLQGVRS